MDKRGKKSHNLYQVTYYTKATKHFKVMATSQEEAISLAWANIPNGEGWVEKVEKEI